jgi:hypothetical protein
MGSKQTVVFGILTYFSIVYFCTGDLAIIIFKEVNRHLISYIQIDGYTVWSGKIFPQNN